MPTLHWLTREQDLKAAANAEYRLLAEEEKYSYGDPDTGNLIVRGDNLEALKALLPFYAGQVKCIYIDPPYNTGSAFEHYDDNMEHTIWLSMMYPRLELLKQFLREDGAIWISIDDREGHYLKIICDEIFGRENFYSDIIWQHSIQGKNDAKTISSHHNHLLGYQKTSSFSRNLIERTAEHNVNYKNPDNDPKGLWRSGDFRSPNLRENLKYIVVTPNGKKIKPPEKGWRWSKELFEEKVNTGEIVFVDDETRIVRKIYLCDQEGRVPESIWFGEEVGTTREATNEITLLFSGIPFATPKPERLLQRIIHISTSPGDLVLDSFLGSGTTAAVAHKMGRKYIGVEMGEQAKTHCVVRLQKVIDGEAGGISEAVGWKGGGGFRFFSLGEAVFDSERRIKESITFENLAAHIYFTETKTPMNRTAKNAKGREKIENKISRNFAPFAVNSPFLGVHNGTGYALLYNGILHDTTIEGGNVLTHKTLNYILTSAEKTGAIFGETYERLVIYGEATRLTSISLKHNNIEFKQTPYDIKVW